jgi:hypothetical protein
MKQGQVQMGIKVGGIWVLMGVILALAVPNTVFAQPFEAGDPWMVATGMGGCAGVTSVGGDLGDLSAWASPEDFVNGLRAKGLQVSTVTAEYHGRYLVKVVVPARKVDTVFVPLSLCREMMQEELRRAPTRGREVGR